MRARTDRVNSCRSKSNQQSGNARFARRSITRRLGPFAGRNFRIFYAGYATSMLGSSMSAIALTFAVLDSGGSPADLGLVFAAKVVPQVLVMLARGMLADRAGRRPVMLITDSVRLVVQGVLAGALFAAVSY